MSYPVFPPHQPASRFAQYASSVDSHHPSKPTTTRHWFRRKFYLLLLALLITLGLGLGLGPGLKQGNITPPSPIPTPTSSSPPSQGNLTIRQPIIGSTWEIILSSAFPAPLLTSLNLTYANTSIFDINLFTHPSSTISALHSAGKKVICYFSAGSYKPARPDSAHFARSDQGAQLDRWAGEFWLNTSSPGVRAIMLARLDLARSNGCDGVDPDNVDGYANAHGLGLSITTALSYLSFLADAAHARGLSIGLKDAGAVVGQVVDVMQWEVNEQCVEFNECAQFRPFMAAEKLVFAIEYHDTAPGVSAETKSAICGNRDARGCSTLIKERDLGELVEAC